MKKIILPIALLVLVSACGHIKGKECPCNTPKCECAQSACKCKKKCSKHHGEHKKKCKVCEESEKAN